MRFNKIFVFAIFSTICSLNAQTGPREALYNSLKPNSLTEALAYFELYGATHEGKLALERARILLGTDSDFPIEKLVSSFNHYTTNPALLSDEVVQLVEKVALSFPNRALLGLHATTLEQLANVADDQIDLGMALLLAEGRGDKTAHYLAALDLMALSVMSKLPADATAGEKVAAINDFLFREKRYRFPAQSAYSKKIDHYTFLSSVIDNHLGVCLGVSSLYLAIAERIGLELEIVTPPGHIYLRCQDNDRKIIIETTARGADLPEETYLSINTKKLKERTKKEVIGLSFINLGSTQMHAGHFQEAIESYRSAALFLPNDKLTCELLGYALLFSGKEEEGLSLLRSQVNNEDDTEATNGTMTEDLLAGHVDIEGIRTLLLLEDENRERLIEKRDKLQKCLDRYPRFRDGIYQIAAIFAHLHQIKEALKFLKMYHEIDSTNPMVEANLAEIYMERSDFTRSWFHLHNATKLVQNKGGDDKTLIQLRRKLLLLSKEVN